ncbi:MAG: hypothetical protein CL710_02775 [Chloroflexi bacterium]|nr:hypothetical protein [Chloroflexota bacterium]
MKNEIFGIGWYLRRTYSTQVISAFYLNNLEIPIIRTHNENIVHWCGGASVIGFNQVDKDVALTTPDQSNNLIALFKVESKNRFANTLHLIEATENLPNIPSVTFYKDPEGIIFGIKETSIKRPDYFDKYWNKQPTHQQLNNEFKLSDNQRGLSSLIIRSKNWLQNAKFYQEKLDLSIIEESKENIELAIDAFTTINFMYGDETKDKCSSRLSSRQSFVFRCRDVKSVFNKLLDNKLTPLERHITEDKAGEIYYFNDLSGQIFGIQTRTKSTRIEDRYAEKKYKL